jgi:polysaccharide biosynthesis transport protein
MPEPTIPQRGTSGNGRASAYDRPFPPDGVRVEELPPLGGSEGETLSGGLAALRRRWLIVLGVTLACVAVAVAKHKSAVPHYAATASVTFDNSTLSQSALQVQTGTSDPTRDGPTNVLIATSRQVATLVKQQLKSQATPEQLLQAINVQVAPNANVLQITASTTDPNNSARLANAFAQQYIAFQASSQVAAITQAQNSLRRQLDALPANSPDRGATQQSIQRLAELGAVADGGSQIISRASVPGAPSGTTLKTSIILGVLVGLALSFAIAFVLESLDRRVSSTSHVEREYRLPVLATIPQQSFRGGRAASRSQQLEPYRILRTAIDFSAVTRKLDTLLVTSAISGEGKTTVAIDLAHAIALTGREVTLVELDLRRPTFAKHFALDPRRGFTSVVVGRQPLADKLIQPFPSLPNFRVLPSGPLPPNPSELLESAAVSAALADLAHRYGMIVIDSAPLNPVADTQILLSNPLIDATIIVARVGHSTRDDIRRARTILDRQLVQPIGVVVTGMASSGAYSYGYSSDSSADLQMEDLDDEVFANTSRRSRRSARSQRAKQAKAQADGAKDLRPRSGGRAK